MNELITKAKEGNREAADKLFRDNCDELYSYCVRLCCNEHDAKDLMQETFLTAFSKIEQYRYDESFRAWLHTIAVHKFYNRIRDDKKYNICELDYTGKCEDELYIPEEYAERNEFSDTVKGIINTNLSDSQRLTVMMYYYDELPVNMIAEKLDCSEGTVKSRLYYSRKILRSELLKKGITLGGTAAVLSSVLRSDRKSVV